MSAQPPRGPEDLEESLTTIVAWAWRHDVQAEVARRASCTLPLATIWLLARIAACGPAHPSDLAAFHAVDNSTITPRLQRLERDGLVQRQPDPGDGRASLVSVTPAGRQLLRRLRRARSQILAELLGDVSPAAWDQIARGVSGLAERLTAAQAERLQLS